MKEIYTYITNTIAKKAYLLKLKTVLIGFNFKNKNQIRELNETFKGSLRHRILSLYILCLCIIFSFHVSAQIAVDATSTGVLNNSSSVTISHTTGTGANRALFVGISAQQPYSTVTSVTYNGISLVKLGSLYNASGTRLEFWYLVGPPSGTYNLVVTNSTSDNAIIGVQTFTGVNQASPLGTPTSVIGFGTNASVSIASASNELVYGLVAFNNGSTNLAAGAGQTEYWDSTINSSIAGAGSTSAGAATVNVSWTSTSSAWTVGAVSIKPAPSVSANPGGVAGAALWLKADSGVSTSGSNVTQWNDASGYSMNGIAYNSPTLSTSNHNFNPTITFNGTNNYIDVNDGFAGFAAGASGFVTARPTANKTWSRFFDFGNGAPSDNINFRRVSNSSDLGYEAVNGTTMSSISASGQITNNTVNTYSFNQSGTTANLYKNGLSLTSGTVQLLQNITRTLNYVGRSNWVADEYYAGDMSEIILFNRGLSNIERQRVDSYLALKYGTTLDQTAAQDYLASDGSTTYWDGMTNSGHKNNIAGIARDDNSALYQKQSQSVNSGLQVVIGNGNTIAATNAANATTISADKSALVWGDNAGSVSAWTTTGAPTSRQIVSRSWKVQETGTVGSVKVQVPDNSGANGLPLEATTVYLLVDADGNFASGATEYAMTLSGTNWEANVDFTSGQYFTFATQVPYGPGGVYSGNILWLRGDAGTNTITNGSNVTSWTDQSIYGYNATTTSNTGSNWVSPGSNPPVYQAGSNANGINFNPSVNFSGSKSLDGAGGLSPYQIFTVYKNVSSPGVAVLGLDDPSGNGGGGQGTLWHDPTYATLGVRNTSNGNNIQLNRTYALGSPSVATIFDIQQTSNSAGSFWINGDGTSATVSISGTAPSPFSTPAKYRLGKASDNTSAASPVIAEVISYNRNLSSTERQQVNSYLGLKYGITLGHNYLNASASTIWNITTNSGYNNNITGIGRDDLSNFNQKQSKSINANSLVTLSVGSSVANDNASNSSTFSTDNAYLIVGDDNGSISSWTTTGAPSTLQIVSRKWKTQVTGTTGTITVQVPDNSSSLTTKLPSENGILYLLVDADGDFSTGATSYAMTLNGTNWEVPGSSLLSSGQYFTFASPRALSVSFSRTHVKCYGTSTGAIDLTVSGGVTPYTFSWSDGATTEDRTNIAAGSYTVTVTDAVNQTISFTMSITQLSQLNASVSHTNVSCYGGTNGTITISSPSGGAGTYQYRLNSGTWQSSGSFTGLASATYSVQIRDAVNTTCSVTLVSELVSQPSYTLYATADAINVSCNGNSNGSINLTVTGGTSPYTYNWGSGVTSEDRTSLAAGTYNVTVTDANSCTTTASATVTQPTALSSSISQTAVTCYSDGSIDLTPSGGTTPYTYDWADVSGGDNTQDRTGLTPGTYNVTITDANGCTTTNSQTLSTPSCATGPTVVCTTNTSDVYNVNPDPVVDSYTWTVPTGAVIVSGQGTPSVTINWSGTSAGTGQVCVRTVNICGESADTCISVLIRNVPAAAEIISPPVCTNEDLKLLASGGVSYSWSGPNGFTSSSQIPTIYSPTSGNNGTYTVTVTDTEGCSATASVPVTVFTAPNSSYSTTLAGCLTANGAIDLTVSSGTAPYTYSWSNGAATQDLSSILAGVYNVTVTDANGCTITNSISLGNTPSPIVTPTITNVACNDGLTGSITIAVSAGIAPYTYNWSTGATSQNISGLSTGTYNVTVTDNRGCKGLATNVVTEPNQLQIDYIQTNVACYNVNTGAINVTVTGGTAPYTYDWADIVGTSNAEDRTSLAAGTYNLTVTDANGCTASSSFVVTQPSAALSASAYVTNVSCNGGSDGIVNLTVTGGTSPYTYLWNSSATTQDLYSLSIGTYDVTVTDANGCIATGSGTVSQPTSLTLSTLNKYISCNGGADGEINLTVSGGTLPYGYAWSSGETTEDVSLKASGSYTVTVTDANGCTANTTQTLTEPTVLAAITTHTNASCNGSTNGSIDLTVSGGTSPYTYSWSSSETSEDISGKTADSYFVTVTDANNCIVVLNAIITEPTAISLTGTVTNVSCNGGTDGAIDITASGGTGSLSYNWGSGVTSEDRTGLSIGTYSVTVTDGNSCTETQSFTITQPTSLSVSTSSVNVTCNGAADGSINLTVTGGTMPYIYNWSNGATTEDVNSLTSGSYTVTVTDDNGCTATTTVVITQPSVLTITPSVTNVLCYSQNTGSISTIVAGGTGPYTYAWSNGESTSGIGTITAGSYTLTVTDANGCSATSTSSITEPASAVSVTASITNVLCNGGNNGSITTTPVGGVSPYTFNWSNGQTTQNISSLIAGSYTVTITDANLCTTQSTYAVSEPSAALSVSSSKIDVGCNGGATGSIDLTVSGGTTPYSYNWSNGATTEDLSGLTAGTYDVTITDANNCTTTTSVTITEPSVLALASSITHAVCVGGVNGAVNVTVTGGTAPFTYNWSNGATTEDISGIAAGSYVITVTDANGCSANLASLINDGTNPIAVITSTESSCTTDDDKVLSGGAATLTASGGLSYAWSTTETTVAITVNPTTTTTYTVTVTDINGCTDTETKTIEVVSAPIATITSNENSCTSDDDKILSGANVSLVAAGGISYSWDNGLGTNQNQIVTPSVTTTYNVTVTDVNGCTSTASKTINIITSPTITITSTENSCTSNDDKVLNGDNINLVASGASMYVWDNGLGAGASKTTTLSATTTYSVTATDVNGCISTANKTIEVISAPTAAISSTENSCTTDDDKVLSGDSANLTATGGVSYVWSTGETTSSITVNPSVTTTYTVTVTDANGCTDIASKTITVISTPTAAIASIENSCTTNDDKVLASATANLTASGGVSYLWSTSETTAAISVNPSVSTTYLVTVTDANGCTAIANKTIEVILAPYAAIDITESSCANNDGKILSGASSALTAHGGISYVWSTTETTNSITVSPVANTTYSVTATDLNGCIATADKTIEIIAPAIAAISSSDTSCTFNDDKILNGASADLTATGGVTYEWSTSEAAATISVFPSVTTVYTVTVTDANGCVATANKTVTVVSDPIASITVVENSCTPNDNQVTSGANVDLTATGGVGYLWSTTQTTANITVNPTVNSSYIVTITDVNGCTATDTVDIAVIAPPVASIASTESSCTSNDDKVLSGASVGLTASGGVSYLWSSGEMTASITKTPSVTTTYTVTVTDVNGCTDIASKTITVISVPTVSITASESSCTSDDDKVLSGANVGLAASGGVSYIWSSGETISSISKTPTTTTTYSVTATDANGCSNVFNKTITIISLPTALISATETSGTANDDKVTIGSNVDLVASGGVSYAWDNSLGTGSSHTVTPIATIIYTVTVTDANGCTDTDSKTIEVIGSLGSSITSTESSCTNNDNKVLSGTSVNLSTTPIGGTAPYTYAWDNGLGTTQSVSPSVTSTTTYHVTITDFNGLTSVASKTLTVISDAVANISGTTTIVNGTSTTLTASGGVSYVWNTSATTSVITVSPSVSTSYTVTVTDSNGCSNAQSVTVTVDDFPTANYDVLNTNEDSGVNSILVLSNDNFGNDGSNTIVITQNPVNGIASINNNGTSSDVSDDYITYTANTNFNGTDSLIYRICDLDVDCDTAIVYITVNSVNDAPIAVVDGATTNEDTPTTISVLSNDSDVDQVLTAANVVAITTNPSNGTAVINGDGTITYTPNLNFNGVDSLIYQVCDNGTPQLCDTAKVFITVNSVNDAPRVTDTVTVSISADSTQQFCTTITDVDLDTTFNAIIICNPKLGNAVATVKGNEVCITYKAGSKAPAQDTVCVQVCDKGGLCDTVVFKINIIPPVKCDFIPDSFLVVKTNNCNGVTPVCIKSSADVIAITVNDSITISNIETCAGGVKVNLTTGTHKLKFISESNCTDSMFVKVVCITPDTIVSVVDSGKVDTICLNTNQLLGKAIYVTQLCASDDTVVTYKMIPNSTCLIRNAHKIGVDSSCFVVCDSLGVCDTTYVITTVKPVIIVEVPQAEDNETTTTMNTDINIDVLNNDTLPNGLTLITIIGQPINGSANIVDSTKIRYTPNTDFCGQDEIVYAVCDKNGCDTAKVYIKVSCDRIKFFNVISPNGDGINDVFVVGGIENFQNNHLWIYNRWGNLVHDSPGYKNDWGGTWEGTPLPDGTYFYVFEDGQGKKYMGYLQLMR